MQMAIDLAENVRPTIEKDQYFIAHVNDNRKDRSHIHAAKIVNDCLGRRL